LHINVAWHGTFPIIVTNWAIGARPFTFQPGADRRHVAAGCASLISSWPCAAVRPCAFPLIQPSSPAWQYSAGRQRSRALRYTECSANLPILDEVGAHVRGQAACEFFELRPTNPEPDESMFLVTLCDRPPSQRVPKTADHRRHWKQTRSHRSTSGRYASHCNRRVAARHRMPDRGHLRPAASAGRLMDQGRNSAMTAASLSRMRPISSGRPQASSSESILR
jgi:hypothetical protein